MARIHSNFADQLQEQARRHGFRTREDRAHRRHSALGWVDLETRIGPQDDRILIAECARGEEATLKHYDHALEQELSGDLQPIIERHARELRGTRDRLRSGKIT